MKDEIIKRFVSNWDVKRTFIHCVMSSEPIFREKSIFDIYRHDKDDWRYKFLFKNDEEVLIENYKRQQGFESQLEILDDEFLLKCLEFYYDVSSYNKDTIESLVYEYCRINNKDYNSFYILSSNYDYLDQIKLDI